MEGVTKDNAMEAEVKAAQQRAIIPLEERIQQFKEMLAEKEVSWWWPLEMNNINIRLFDTIGFSLFYMGKRTAQNCVWLSLPLADFERK